MDIFKAVMDENLNSISSFLANGLDINIKDHNGMTPLIIACDNNKAEAVKFLIKAKADPDLTDKWGQTALMLAAGRNNIGIIMMLIKAKADLNIKAKNGLTAYGYAFDNGYKESSILLKKNGAK